MILDRARVESILAMAREIGRAQPLYDVHVSPYEVIFCELEHAPNGEHPGLLSLEGASYREPRAGALRIDDAAASEKLAQRREVPAAFSKMMMRKQYAHMGPRVVADHMELSGIGKSLLIPVHRPGADPAEQARLMFDVYGDDPRFAFAYCPRALGSEAEATAELRSVAALHPLTAVKVNANIQAIDVATEPGRACLEHLMAACRTVALPMIVHGGVSRLLKDPRARSFAALENLCSVPWRAAGVPVVICHAGMFGSAPSELDTLLPRLLRLMADNPNLLVDISGLSFTTLCAVLEQVDRTRVVFGSDALYFPQWSAVVKVLHALDQLGLPIRETFAMLAGTNPAQHIFCQERP